MSETLDGYLSLDALVKDAKENLDEVTRKRDMFKQELIKAIGRRTGGPRQYRNNL